MTDPVEVQWFRTDSAEKGPARAALDESLGGRSLAGMELVTAEIARGAAELTDSARRAQDPRLWLAASQRLMTLTASLSSRPGPSNPEGGSSDGDAGAGDDGEHLAALLGAGPEVGDAADA